MPDHLDSMAVFIEVADQGSFVSAADRICISPQMVAKHIAALEARLGVRLIVRTTRRQRLTDFGQTYLEHCRATIIEVQEMAALATELQTEPRGLLRVNAPHTLGTFVVTPFLVDFLQRYRSIDVSLTLSDEIIDQLQEGYDAVIRVGPVSTNSSSLVARRLSEFKMIAYASPQYLERRGRPCEPEDLSGHECIFFNQWSRAWGSKWAFSRNGRTVEVPVKGRLTINEWRSMHRAALMGHGITLGYKHALKDDIAAGRIIPLLSDWEGPSRSVHLIYARDRRMSSKLRVFVEDMIATFPPDA